MAVIDQVIQDQFSIYNGDSAEVLQDIRDDSIHHVIYSPPFASMYGSSLYQYSSNPRDVSNCEDYDTFFKHYEYIVTEIYRIMLPGRICAVHCMDVPNRYSTDIEYTDFPGDIIRLHQRLGFKYKGRHCIWKEPLGVRLRTMAKHLAHKTIVDDSTLSGPACADYLLLLQKKGDNPIPVSHPNGFTYYVGDDPPKKELEVYIGYEGKQTENLYSHQVWQRYASAFWKDSRTTRVLDYKPGKESEDERHIHPLQLDVIERSIQLYTNPGEIVLSPFAGVGSEVYGAVINGRKGIGIELKSSYYKQMVRNMEHAVLHTRESETLSLFD